MSNNAKPGVANDTKKPWLDNLLASRLLSVQTPQATETEVKRSA
jgi:hypothetical protein